jgi:hypothetical protein
MAATARRAAAAGVLLLLAVALVALAVRLFRARGAVTGGGARGGRAARTFPWSRGFLPPPGEMFRTLATETVRAEEGAEGPVLVRRYPEDYERADALSNHYTEEARMRCRAGQAPAPLAAWARLAPVYSGCADRAGRGKMDAGIRERAARMDR